MRLRKSRRDYTYRAYFKKRNKNQKTDIFELIKNIRDISLTILAPLLIFILYILDYYTFTKTFGFSSADFVEFFPLPTSLNQTSLYILLFYYISFMVVLLPFLFYVHQRETMINQIKDIFQRAKLIDKIFFFIILIESEALFFSILSNNLQNIFIFFFFQFIFFAFYFLLIIELNKIDKVGKYFLFYILLLISFSTIFSIGFSKSILILLFCFLILLVYISIVILFLDIKKTSTPLEFLIFLVFVVAFLFISSDKKSFQKYGLYINSISKKENIGGHTFPIKDVNKTFPGLIINSYAYYVLSGNKKIFIIKNKKFNLYILAKKDTDESNYKILTYSKK